CPHQYIVEVDNDQNRQLRPWAEHHRLAGSDQTWCEGFWVRMGSKGFKSSNASWTALGSFTMQGRWMCTGGVCTCVAEPTEGTIPPIQPANHGYSKVRTVAQAGWAN